MEDQGGTGARFLDQPGSSVGIVSFVVMVVDDADDVVVADCGERGSVVVDEVDGTVGEVVVGCEEEGGGRDLETRVVEEVQEFGAEGEVSGGD